MKRRGAGHQVPAIRLARAADLRHLAAIEDSGARQFEEIFGEDIVPALLAPAMSGTERAARAGFLLVAGESPVGFAHVLEVEGHAHLEQLSVRPEAQCQGIGSALVRAAMDRARAAGYRELSLCTYRDVPWNGPFYGSLGFREVTELSRFHQAVRDREVALGLDTNGVRVVMTIELRREVTRE